MLASTENHVVDAEHLIGGGASAGGSSEWVDRGYDLDQSAHLNSWLNRLRRLVAQHRRLRLYGDDHPTAAVQP
jgi:hypothetical protein